MIPIVLLHGALGAKSQLEPFAEELRKLTDRPIYTYQCTGHGGEDVPTNGFTMAGLAADFGKWLQRENLLGADIFGYSMGGYIALLTVKNHPERVRHVLTYGTKFHWTPESAEAEKSQIIPEKIREKVPKFAAYLERLHGDKWEDVMRATAVLMTDLGSNPLLNDYTTNFIQHPVVLTRGSRDVMVSAEETQNMATSLPDARYEEIEGWPHPVQLLDPKEVALQIQRYLME